jgi:hypothetical protein
VAPLAPKARKRAAQSARRAVDFLHARHGAGRDFLEELQNG